MSSIYRVVSSGLYVGQLHQNVIHFQDPNDTMTYDTVKTEVLDNFILQFRNLQNAGYVWTQMTVQKMFPVLGIPVVYALSGQAGVFAGAGAPTVLAALFSVRTGSPGRHGHGRIYMGGVHGSSVVDSVMPSATYTNYQSKAANLKARFCQGGSGPLRLVVVNRSNIGAFIVSTDVVVRPTFGIQRRRNIGVGS